MINNTIQNKSSKIKKIQEHELVIINHLKKFYSLSESERKNTSVSLIKELKWFNHIFYNKPISLLFSIDQFFFEFAKKQLRRKKTSEFQRQLKERKKLSFFYGYLSKKQVKNLIVQSKKYQGYFSKNFFSLLERRLDIVLYRSGLVKNIVTARQLISHKKVKVNNQILNIASYQVYPGDIISLTPSSFLFFLSERIEEHTLSCPTKGSFSRKKRKSNDFPKLFSKIHNFTSWKIDNKKKLLKNFISLLLSKVEKRVYIKLEKAVFLNKKNELVNLLVKKKNEKKNFFTLLKFKPLFSKQAQSFLFTCIQKNYLSVDRKPLFSNKYPYFKEFAILQNKYFKKKQNQGHQLVDSHFTRKFSTGPALLSIDKINKDNKKKSFQEKKTVFLNKKDDYSLIYSRKRNTILYRNFVSRTLLLMHLSPFLFFFSKNRMKKDFTEASRTSKPFTNTLLTLKFKNNITKKRTTTFYKVNSSFISERKNKNEENLRSTLRFIVKKPIHLEVSYSLSTIIFLYSPQRLTFPFSIDVDLVLRSFQ